MPDPSTITTPDTLTPPQDIGAEMAVLGAMLVSPECMAFGLRELKAVDFYEPEHTKMFGLLLEVTASLEPGEKVDILILESAMHNTDWFERIGGRTYLIGLAESYGFLGNVTAYVRIIRQKAVLRRLAQAGLETVRRAALPGADAATVVEESSRAVLEVGKDMSRGGPAFVSALSLIAQYPELRPALIEGLLRRGEILNLIAAPKFRKSWLVLALALCVAAGRPWLGFPVTRGRVLLIDNELHPETLAHRLPKVMEALGIAAAEIEGWLSVKNLRGQLCDIYGMETYFHSLEVSLFSLIVLDAWYRFQPADTDENSNSAVTAAYNQLNQYAQHLNCSFAIVHHASKGFQNNKSIADVGAGAGAQARAADCHTILREHAEPDCVVLEATVRTWKPVEPMCLRWEYPVWRVAPDLDPADLKKAGTRRKQPKPKSKSPTWDVKTFVAECLTTEPATIESILEAAVAKGLKRTPAGRLLKTAVDKGLAHRWKFGPRNPVKFATTPQPRTEAGGQS
jgi:hypothetical protein